MEKRPCQVDALNAVRKGWGEFRKQLVVAPTGFGKAALFSWMAQEEFQAGRRTMILVDRNELVTQAVEKVKIFTGIHAQVEKAEFKASKHAEVVVGTVQTLASRKETWPADHFDLVVADEADLSISDSWQSVLKYFDPAARVCGFTATPKRTDLRDLGEYYENIAYQISLFDVIKLGFLSPICVQQAPLRIDLTGVHLKNGDFDTNELDHAITPYLSSAVQAIKQFASDRKTLVFLPLIRTSERFIDLCREAGMPAEHIDGKSEDRTEKLQRFKRNEFSILANSSLLLRGYDDPGIDCVVVLRPTKSSTLYKQCIGRGTRIAEGKDNLLIIDFLWQTEKHMVCRPASLIATSDEEAEQMTEMQEKQAENGGEELDLISLQSDAAHEREEALRKKLAALADRKARFISAEEFAVQHNRIDIAEFTPVMKWQFDSCTEKQAEWLSKAGVDPSTVKGKGHASQILDVYFKELGAQPASHKQRWVMSQSGWRSKDGARGPFEATRDDAKEFFAARNKG